MINCTASECGKVITSTWVQEQKLESIRVEEPFWDVSVEDAMPMTLYDKDGNTIMCYMPDDPQWWITGFDPMIQDVKPKDLTVIGSIDMSSNSELWEAFLEEYGGTDCSVFCFDEENKTVYYNW